MCIVLPAITVPNVYRGIGGNIVQECVLKTVLTVRPRISVKSVNLVFTVTVVIIIVIHNVLPVTQAIPALPAMTAGLDVYANVAKTAKMKDAMAMESAKAGVTAHIMGNVVIFPVL